MDFSDLPLDGQVYRIGKMDAMTQFHVARRIGPIMASVTESAQAGGEFNLLDVMATAAQVIAKMSDDDVEYVIARCLSVVGRIQPDGRAAAVWRGKSLMFNDIQMPAMVRLSVEVVKENLGPFFPGLLAAIATPSDYAAAGAPSN